MALKVKIEKIKTKGKIWVFIFFFIMLLIIFAAFLFSLLLLGGYPISKEYLYDYIQFSPLTILVPFIVALTSTISYRTSLMSISPASNVNVDKLQEFLFKSGYRVLEEKPGFIKFERSKLFQRILWLNIDKPTIEIKQDEVLLTVDKHTEVSLTPLLIYGKRYDLHPDD
ncbi:MAG: hypothetical protein AB9846_12745 [Tenuifilaceae bacterium]